jgi:ABC-type dipeptide/oligopeptide/nickel transport system permease component
MFSSIQTTALILAWCFVLSTSLAGLSFAWVTRLSQKEQHDSGVQVNSKRLPNSILPALVAAPVALLVMFRAFGINLMFPLMVDADGITLIRASLAPAVVLLVTSGLASQLVKGVAREVSYWRQKTFTRVAFALGRDPKRELRRLVLLKTLAGGFARCLPWLFGELVVVEAVFNAPGLGSDAWHFARIRDLASLATTVAWLTGLYVLSVLCARLVHAWIGRRLESYA